MSVDAFTAQAWLEYGREYARYPCLWDSSLAFASGPLMPEGATLRDYSGRTAGATWSVGAGDVPKYVQVSVKGQPFWAGSFDGSNDYADAGGIAYSATGFSASCWVYVTDLSHVNLLLSAYGSGANYFQHVIGTTGRITSRIYDGVTYIGRASPNGTIAVNSWYHIAMNWTGVAASSAVSIFVNGGRADSNNSQNGTFASASAAAITSMKIGAQKEPAETHTLAEGYIAAARIMRRNVLDAEISTLSTHPLEAFRTVRPKYWMFPTTHLWPWQIRRSRRVRGSR